MEKRKLSYSEEEVVGEVGSSKRARRLEEIKEINKFWKGVWKKILLEIGNMISVLVGWICAAGSSYMGKAVTLVLLVVMKGLFYFIFLIGNGDERLISAEVLEIVLFFFKGLFAVVIYYLVLFFLEHFLMDLLFFLYQLILIDPLTNLDVLHMLMRGYF